MTPSSSQAASSTAFTNLRPSSRNSRASSEIIITANSSPSTRSMHTRASSAIMVLSPPAPKRQRLSHIPKATTTPASPSPSITVTPTVSSATVSSAKHARDIFFDSLVAEKSNSETGLKKRDISSADNLDKHELMRCFYLLHACGRATQTDASLETTRKSIEGFLDAVFNEWFAKGDDEIECGITKPVLDMQVEADVPAGSICANRDKHKSWLDCAGSDDCKSDITARVIYTSDPPAIKLDFTKGDATKGESSPVSPLQQQGALWRDYKEWLSELRDVLQKKAIAQVHKHNKHLAIWKARVMIRTWAKNEDYKEGCSGDWGFITAQDVRLAMMILGDGD